MERSPAGCPVVCPFPVVVTPSGIALQGYGASDGKITGWLPAEGEDPPLWHMVHGNHEDEEDLDEAGALYTYIYSRSRSRSIYLYLCISIYTYVCIYICIYIYVCSGTWSTATTRTRWT